MMEIKPLSREVVSKIRSTCSINNLSQCVTELVLNSLDAKSSAVAIRLNSVNFRIQVVDNGVGISQENLDKIARKYSTSKCQTLMDLEKKPKSYGYKGESLWSISNVSKTLVITSKYASSENTFSKSINLGKHGKVAPAKRRQSNGTTITVDSFFHNLPVRQKRLKKEFEFEEIITFLKSMSIIHPQISITLRDDITGTLLFKRPKSENIIKSFTDLYPEIKYDDTVVIKVQKDKVTLEALLSKEFFEDNNIQHIFVNKRPVHHSKLQAFICKELSKVAKKKIQSVKALYPAYVLNIKCSISNYIIMYENSEPKVDFLNIDIIHRCIEKLISNFRGETEINEVDNKPTEKRKSVCGVSDLVGAVKGFGFKDWLENPETGKEESCVIEDVTEQSEFQLKKIEPMRKHKISPVKKGKLKSLPIRKQKHNKLKTSRESEYKEKELEGKRYQEEEQHFENNIIVEHREENIADETKMKKFCRLERNCADILAKKIPDETLFSNFTNTEEKGKDFLMYMFLKSTELFKGDTSFQPTQISEDNSDMNINNSIETIMESNIFFQNITKSKNHQFNENISVSVRLKRKKNTNVYKGQSNFSEIFAFSIPEKKKRKNGYFNEKSEHKSGNYLTSPYFGTKKLDPNYSSKRNIIKKPKGSSFLFGDENTNKLMYENQYDGNFTILRSCKSNHNYSKNIKPHEVKNCFDQLSNNFCFLNFTKNNLLYDTNKSYVFNFQNDVEFEGGLFDNNQLMNGKLADNNSRRIMTFNSGKLDYNLPSEVFDFNNLPFSPIPKVKITPEKNREDEKLNDVIINSENRTLKKPVNDLTFLPNSAVSFDVEGIFDDKHFDEDKDLRTLTAIETAQTSNLIITLNENVVNEHKINTAINTKANVEGEIPAGDIWLTKFDPEGNEFYFNERTGMTSFVHPKKQEIYILKERPHFLPKGLSPVLIPDPKLEKSLSPISKEKLHDEILKSYSNDLGVVKWEKFIRGSDPKKFFESLYKERVNEYEKEVPNIIRTKMSKIPLQILNDNKFNKMLFKDLKVIGQIDQKFIATIDRKTSYLILFDQHAVHERIRLEDLLKEYEGKSSKCENVTLLMKGTDLDLLRSHQKYLDGIGIHFRFLKNGITVNAVPMCFSNKITKESPLSKLIQILIREVLDLVKDTRGVLTGLPKMISQIINMEACRGSVKFGEFLNKGEMERLIEQVSRCALPFQCAHGRPTMIPLLTLDDKYEANVEGPSLQNLRPI
ncbi:DNA mismatch repair protein Mlh3-like [Coccinella septempunctata]|uniref:DNA mismatch repair protein Mlh3-like n=1 Tax=Coccinella septempunctata TaxID=41139 RepID=UPI001D088403|nr:DNA mismatch repair protein Mlh3-like [Coccinella septempunctata]